VTDVRSPLSLLTPALTLALTVLTVGPASAGSLDQGQVRDAIEAAAQRNLPDTVVQVEARDLKVYGDLDVSGEVELRVLGTGEWLGRQRLEVEVTVAGATVGTVPASVEIVGFVEIPVLRRSAGKGTRLRLDHISSLTRPLDAVPSGAVPTVGDLVGRTVKRDLRLGSVVRESDLAARVDARRGRPVTVRLSSGAMRIQTTGVLQEDGGVGAWVGVVTAAGAELRGLLIAPDVVELALGPATGGSR